MLATTPSGTPIYVRDVGTVRFAPMIRQGAATRDGRGEAVTAIVYLLAGENGRVVVGRIKEKIKEIQESLPEGVVIDTYYDRSVLIEKTIGTVAHNLAEGGILVIAVLLVLLGNLRAGLIVALAIPLSMLFAGNLMLYFGIAGSLMSLGAIDFGLIVDSAVIVIENCVSHLAHADPKQKASTSSASATLEVRKPVVFGVAIITMVHLPILALEGVEGKMFRPMALTVIFALTGSLLLSLTATPVLASFVLRPGTVRARYAAGALGQEVYAPTLRAVLRHPAAGGRGGPGRLRRVRARRVAAGRRVHPAARRGGPDHRPDASPELLARGRRSLTRPASRRRSCAEFPDEIRTVVSRIGRPEIGLEAGGREPDRHLGPAQRSRALVQGRFEGGTHRPRSRGCARR